MSGVENKTGQANKRERGPVLVSFSSSIILTASKGGRLSRMLVLTQQTKDSKWGLIAGAFRYNAKENGVVTISETARIAVERELEEETDMGAAEISRLITSGAIFIQSEEKLKLGFIFKANVTDSERVRQIKKGYEPKRGEEIMKVKGFCAEDVLELLQYPKERIYKPEYNLPVLEYWAYYQYYDKYEPWEGSDFAHKVAEGQTGINRNCLEIFQELEIHHIY